MRFRGLLGIYYGKVQVCREHAELMLSPRVREQGMDWQVDRWLCEAGAK